MMFHVLNHVKNRSLLEFCSVLLLLEICCLLRPNIIVVWVVVLVVNYIASLC